MKTRLLIGLTFFLLLALVSCSSDATSPAGTVATQATAFSSTLVAKHSGKCLDIEGGSFSNASPFEQESCTSSEAPEFEFVAVAGQADTYLIRNKKSQKCLDVYRAYTANSAPVIQYSCGNVAHRQFELVSAGDSYYQLKAKHSGKCVDVRYASSRDGAEIVQYSCHALTRTESGNQLWKISAQGDSGGGNDQTPETAFTSTLTAKHSGKCLDLKGGSFRNGAALEQESCASSEAPTFAFMPVTGKSDTYLIKNAQTGKCLDVFRTQTANGADLIQYSCGEGANQQFELVSAGNGYYQLKVQHSGKCVDVYRAYQADGAEVNQYSCQGAGARAENGNQLWKINTGTKPTQPEPQPEPEPEPEPKPEPEPEPTPESEGGDVEPFTLVALPDTQTYVCCGGRYTDLATAQTEWIVDSLDKLDIDFVTHEGDLVDDASITQEWRDADRAMDVLDGKVPYSVAMGDHDYYPEEVHDGDTSNFRRYFGESRYQSYDWYGDAGPRGLSHYQIFDGGGVEFLHLAVEWEAPSDALSWAKRVIEDHPDMPTIITTHAYLRDGGSSRGGRRTTQNETEACVNLRGDKCNDPGNDKDAASGEKIFQTLVNPYPQVFMVLNGHYHNNGRRSSNPNVSGCNIDADGFKSTYDKRLQCDNGEYRQVSTNSAGSKVYEMLANYQSYENGGNGWLRIIKFLPGEGTNGLDRIKVQTYSPTLDKFQSGSASNFSYDLDFSKRFGLK